MPDLFSTFCPDVQIELLGASIYGLPDFDVRFVHYCRGRVNFIFWQAIHHGCLKDQFHGSGSG